MDQDQRDPGGYSSDQSDDEPTVPDLQRLSTEGNSRRNFLKAAVVASAAAATAGGAAAFALSSGRAPAPLIRFIGDINSGDPCDACIEGTMYTSTPRAYCTANNNSSPPAFSSTTTNCAGGTLAAGFTVNSQGHPQGDFEIFFVDHAPVAATGSAKINLTITVTGTAVSNSDSNTDIDSSSLFNFVGGGSSVLVTEQSSVPSAPCMSGQSTTLGTFKALLAQKDSLHGASGAFGTSGINYSPVGANDDVLVQLHMKWVGGKISNTADAAQLYTFKFSWTDTGTGGTSCTKYLYIYGQQTD